MKYGTERPVITWLLIAINIIVFEVLFSLPEPMFKWVFDTFSFSLATSPQVWRWITNMFLQANSTHLFFNMISLYFFGKVVENQMGKKWWLAIYFVSGLLGNFAFMFTSTVPAVGASAAVFGLMGAAMFLRPLERIHLFIFPLPLGIVAIILATFESLIVAAGITGPVANIAHVAGLLAGIVFAFFHSPKKAAKGLFILIICAILIVLLVPFLFIITAAGGLVLQVAEIVVGFFLYGIAKLLGVLW